MKAMTYLAPNTIQINNFESKEFIPGSVRIKSLFSGISHGTEMAVYRGNAPFYKKVQDGKTKLFNLATESQSWKYPINSCDPGVWYMGYSVVGEVIEIASDVTTLVVGDIVYVSAPHMSEIVCQASQCIKIPETVKPQNAVVLTNLLTAFNGILDSRIKLGDIVVVSGLGVLGQLAIQMAKMSGATVIGIDVFNIRLENAKNAGADYVLSAKNSDDIALEVKEITNNRGADLIIEVSGNQKALHQAIRMASYDGVVTCLGWYQGNCTDVNLAEEFHHNRVTLRSSQTCGIDPQIKNTWDDTRKLSVCCNLLEKLDLDGLITTMIPFDQAQQAYEMIDKNPDKVIQVVLKYE